MRFEEFEEDSRNKPKKGYNYSFSADAETAMYDIEDEDGVDGNGVINQGIRDICFLCANRKPENVIDGIVYIDKETVKEAIAIFMDIIRKGIGEEKPFWKVFRKTYLDRCR